MNCPYCNSPVDFTDSKKIYGESYGMVYVCRRYPECDAYVGAHKSGGQPLGTLANAELRRLRMHAHKLFDPLWRGEQRRMERSKAYVIMRQLLDMPTHQCHIGMMDRQRCGEFIFKLKGYLKTHDVPKT